MMNIANFQSHRPAHCAGRGLAPHNMQPTPCMQEASRTAFGGQTSSSENQGSTVTSSPAPP